MSDSHNVSETEKAVPKAKARKPKRLSIVWLLPLVTILVAGWLGYRAIEERGPTIQITFQTADDLEAGKTKIMYKGVQTGSVKSITLSKDLSETVVEAEMVKGTEMHLTEGTQFWVVRPKVGLTGISGLGTLVSGAYVAMHPGSGATTKKFKGLDEAPLSDVKGTTFTLHADRLGSIHDAAPVLYRDVTVGEVVKHDLGKDGVGVDVQIEVYPDYANLVRKNSVFWNSSGIDVDLGNIFDASIEIDSIASLVAGGIAFATPRGASEAAEAGAAFKLHNHRPDTMDVGEGTGLILVMTAKAPNGVTVGDPVTFREITVGRVIDSQLAADAEGVEITLLIERRHASLVHEKSIFWNASGVDLNLGNLLHPNIKIESLESLVAGGIAFYNPAGAVAGAEAKDGQRFALLSGVPKNLQADGEVVEETFDVTLSAPQSEGISERAPVLYRGVSIGVVSSLDVDTADDSVVIGLAIEPKYAGLIHEKTIFWNISGIKVDAGDLVDAKVQVQSLKTVVRGGVALANPAAPGPAAKSGARFQLRDTAPASLVGPAKPAGELHIVLKADVEGSVKPDDPVLYREVQVGKVASIELSDEADLVLMHVDIEPRYARLVQTNTVFWNASGIHASFGLFSGAKINIESLSALLRGGIAFATPPSGGKAVASGAAFTLHSEAKKEWQSWAPHIRLPAEPPSDEQAAATQAPESKAAAGAPAAPEQTADEATKAEPEAEEPQGESISPDTAATEATTPIPDAVTLTGGSHVSTYVLKEALSALGFADIDNVQHDGNVIHATASWQGEAVKLQIDTENGAIKTVN